MKDIERYKREQERISERLKKLVENCEKEVKEEIKKLISPLEILCSSHSMNDVMLEASQKVKDGYDGPLLMIKGKESEYRWFAKAVEQRMGKDPRGEVYMVFYLRSAKDLLNDLNNRNKFL